MAARTSGKPKQANKTRSPSKALIAKKAAEQKALPAKSRRTKPASTKKARTAKPIASQGNMETELLIEQNQSLRDELEQANARIKHLEELNKNVVNRIDWVIDSLQSVLKR